MRTYARTPVAIRLLAKISPERPVYVAELGPCWPYTGARTAKGYGVIRDDAGQLAYAHRVALALALGRPLRPGMFGNHRCDFKSCIRPAHLYEGTQAENEADKHAYFIARPIRGDAIGTLPLGLEVAWPTDALLPVPAVKRSELESPPLSMPHASTGADVQPADPAAVAPAPAHRPGHCAAHPRQVLVTHRAAGKQRWGEDPATVCVLCPAGADDRCRWCGGPLFPPETRPWQVSERRAFCTPACRLHHHRAAKRGAA